MVRRVFPLGVLSGALRGLTDAGFHLSARVLEEVAARRAVMLAWLGRTGRRRGGAQTERRF